MRAEMDRSRVARADTKSERLGTTAKRSFPASARRSVESQKDVAVLLTKSRSSTYPPKKRLARTWAKRFWWRCRESNPGPSVPEQSFSGRSLLRFS